MNARKRIVRISPEPINTFVQRLGRIRALAREGLSAPTGETATRKFLIPTETLSLSPIPSKCPTGPCATPKRKISLAFPVDWKIYTLRSR